MASSSSKSSKSYDVFLSFNGPDVRHQFLDHLYAALNQEGIYTFIDSEELRKEEQISPALVRVIEESQMAIVIFSEGFASSPWCLEEVTEIMECKEQKDLMVLPVFYKVEPREVGEQRQSYGEAMAKHEAKFGKDSEKVKRWKKALSDAGCLSGWHFTGVYEVGLMQQIVQAISTQLGRKPIYVAKYPVGIDSRVQELKTILNLQSKDDVLMIGLWGQGGVGKTTLAKAIYNTIFREFEGASFLEHVRENCENSIGLVSLQEKLLSQLLSWKKIKISSVDGGIQLAQDRLCNKKVLIILDDVDNECQLNALAGDQDWFGKGSRIIITTRNKHLLTSHGVNSNHMYEVKVLEDGDALELFRKYAFPRNKEIIICSDLVDQALHYARGLPLALEVLGSFLRGRREREWKSALQKLGKSPHKVIYDVLKLSYDGLEDNEKEIFLDIACFFKGRSTQYIKKVLDSCDFDTTIGLQILIERSLVSEEFWTLQMHDLIQSMGMHIVKEECHENPGKRSRLWLTSDVLDVQSKYWGTNAINAIVLQPPISSHMDIGPDFFTNMTKLRMLILLNVYTSFQGPIHLPNELRWFEWPNCGSPLEFSSGPKKLVGLDVRNSKIKVMPEQFKDFRNLKFINFSECRSLVCLSSLDCTPNLKELNLSGCKNLERVHESVAYHDSLQLLNLSGCSKLHHFPDVLQSKNLQLLDLRYCSKLQRFPDIPKKIRGLRKLSLVKTSIEELPASIENLVSLNDINLTNCKKLAILPSSIYRLQNLIYLGLGGCSKLIKFPKKEEDSSDPHTKTGFPKLWYLHLKGCNLSEVEFLENPSCFPNLWSLDVSYCQQLKEIHKIPGQLHLLNAANCKSLRKIPSNIHHLESVYLPSCHELVSNGLTVNDLFNLEHFNPRSRSNFLLPGGEMPQWLLPNKEGYISFTASKDLYKKFVALAICVVFRREERTEFVPFVLEAFVNGRRTMTSRFASTSSYLDHVWLRHCEPRGLWGGLKDAFGANDRSQFHLMIRATWTGGIVKKCGFRLICKPLEDDLVVLLKDDQLLDSALVYEIQNEDCQTGTEDVSLFELLPDKLMDVLTVEKCRYSLISPCLQNVRPGGEMPEEFILVEDGTISFMASQDLYDKFLGLALCVVVGVEGGKKEISFDIVPHVQGQKRNALSGTLGSFDSDHMWIQYLKPNVLWGVLEGGVDFGQFNESYLRFSIKLRLSGGTVKMLGYVLRCTRLEDDLKVLLEKNHLVDPAVLYEDSSGGTADSLAAEFLRKLSHSREKQEASESETD